MKQIGWILTGLILLGVLTFGPVACNNSTLSNTGNTDVNDFANKNDIKNQITNQVKANKIEPSKLEVVSSDKFNQHIIAMFIFYDKSNVLYAGIARLTLNGSKYKVEDLNYNNSNREMKIYPYSASGVLDDNPDGTRNMFISIGGIINDKDIKEVSILYTDNQSVVIKVDPKYSNFFHTRFENNIYIKEIKGLNENGEEIFSQKTNSKP